MNKTTHIAKRGAERTLCGRVKKNDHPHITWPLCKTCLKRSLASAHEVVFSYKVDQDGWVTNTPPHQSNYSVSSSSNTVSIYNVRWTIGGAA